MPDSPSLPERAVARFEKAREELDTFLKDDGVKEVMMEYATLVETYNRALDTATRAVKSHLRTSDQGRVCFGAIGAQKRYKRYYDVEFLANTLPAAQADLVLTEVVTHTLDTELLDQLTRQGEIDNELVRKAYHEEEQSPASLPGTPKPYRIPQVPFDD